VLSGNDASAAAGNQSKYDLNVIYKSGPLVAAFTYAKVQGVDKGWSLGGSYNLGAATIAASYQDPTGANKGFTIGASTKAGPVMLTFDIARVTSGVKNTDFLLEAKYPLSKRTFAYGAFHREGQAKVNTYGVGVRHNF
jgi:predicted porin